MSPPLDKLFLFIAIIALPNLFYRAEYNVPLFIFCFALWYSRTHKSTILYILILSWFIDIFCILKSIAIVTQSDSIPTLVLIVQVIVFFLKITSIIMMIVFDPDSRSAIMPQNIMSNFVSSFVQK